MGCFIVNADAGVPWKVIHEDGRRSCAITREIFLTDSVKFFSSDTDLQALFHQHHRFEYDSADGGEALQVFVVINRHIVSNFWFEAILHLVQTVFCVVLLGYYVAQ